jgi:hypothetical protein
MTYYFGITLDEHAVLLCDRRVRIAEGAIAESRNQTKIWRVNDWTVVTGSGLMVFVEAWATMHFGGVFGETRIPLKKLRASLPGLQSALVGTYREVRARTNERLAEIGREPERQCTTITLGGYSDEGVPFLIACYSVEEFQPRVQEGSWRYMSLSFLADEQILCGWNEQQVREIWRAATMLRNLPSEAERIEVAEHILPPLIRRVSLQTDSVSPDSDLVTVGPRGVRWLSVGQQG